MRSGQLNTTLALGEHRAIQAKDYLTKLGVPPARIKTVSYGLQRPKACRARRAGSCRRTDGTTSSSSRAQRERN